MVSGDDKEKPLKLLVTGATGFIGSHLLKRHSDHSVTALSRSRPPCTNTQWIPIDDIETFDDWQSALTGVDVIIHTIAKVHCMEGGSYEDYCRVNVGPLEKMAKAAASCDVKRLVLLSTIKVNGEHSQGHIFSIKDHPTPTDPYGRSKWEAEQILAKISKKTGLETVIVRPPLVYGPGVKANFQRLHDMANSLIPLPFAGCKNRRDMISVYNLCDLLLCCAEHPSAAGNTFLASDGRPYSLAELITTIRQINGRPPRLLYFPVIILRLLLKAFGKKAMASRLFDDLQVNMAETQSILSWQPKYTLADTLKKMHKQPSSFS